MEPPLLSPGADSSALDEPLVDYLVKQEESGDVEGELNRLLKCLNKEFTSIQRQKIFLASAFLFPTMFKIFCKQITLFQIPGIA